MSLHPTYEAITVSTTALSLSAATYVGYRTAVITVEDFAVRFRVDGTNPTATEGHLVNAGGKIVLGSADEIAQFRVIRQSSGDAKLRVSYGNEGDSLRIDDSATVGSVSIGSVTVSNSDGATSVPVQGSAATDIIPADGVGLQVIAAAIIFETGFAALAADSNVVWSVSRDTKAAMAYYDDPDILLCDGINLALTTSGSSFIPSQFTYDMPEGMIIVEPLVYAQLDSSGTALSNKAHLRLWVEEIKLSEVEILRLLNNI